MALDLAGFQSHAACVELRLLGSVGMRRNVLQDESSRRRDPGYARRKARFSAVVTTSCQRFPALSIAREFFPDSRSMRKQFDATTGVPDRMPAALPDTAALKYAVSLG
ncbi:hypothetical protein [Paraburkholderia rhynchosiae]|uniref:hypothetical protein n=1 Tax=Paraburkholderia rhynchosiae TaxID=487049 RepID=UPI0011AEE45E|nr:hypothetical protein [Paraburkholderia rhynchosiae]